jgi:hypothetical protein
LGADDPDLMATLDAMKRQPRSIRHGQPRFRQKHSQHRGTFGGSRHQCGLANPALTDRAAQIQDLADKLGKAMGERLQEQLEEWRMEASAET